VTAEIGDIFRTFGDAYRQQHQLPLYQHKAMRALARCRTAELGGHREQCDHCGHLKISYNSCRNRHCPKCQGSKTAVWLGNRQQDILPVPYFHVVFTVPAELNPLLLRNQRVGYGLMFRAMADTLRELTLDPKHLSAEVGVIALLHTWGQNLLDHPHLHCLVTGGGLTPDGKRWKSCRKKFFLPVKVVSRLFRGKFLALLRQAFARNDLKFPGQIARWGIPENFAGLIRSLRQREWVVHCKPPFKYPERVLEYLGRYTHRVAITNRRIAGCKDGRVTFRWKDYRDNDRWKTMTVSAFEFMRRFLLHILPPGFVKVRYYGLYASRCRRAKLARCRELLGAVTPPTPSETDPAPGIYRCPVCSGGRMLVTEIIQPATRPPPRQGWAA